MQSQTLKNLQDISALLAQYRIRKKWAFSLQMADLYRLNADWYLQINI